MITDLSNTLVNNLALPTVDTNLHNLGDVIDITNLRNLGSGLPPLYLAILITSAVTSAGAATVQFSLVSDSRNPPGTDGNQNIHWQSAALAKATLILGYQLIVPLPQEFPAYAEFIGLNVQAGTAVLTGGTVFASFTKEPDNWKAYPSAVYY
jgi:hypothetical protein